MVGEMREFRRLAHRKCNMRRGNIGDAVKLRHGLCWTSLLVGRPSLGQAMAIRLTPTRAHKIANALTEWADKQKGGAR